MIFIYKNVNVFMAAYGLYVTCICITIIYTFLVRVDPMLPALNYPCDTCTYFLFQGSLQYACAPCTYIFQCYLHLFIHQTTVNYYNLACTHVGQTCSMPVCPYPGPICVLLIHWGFNLLPSFCC